MPDTGYFHLHLVSDATGETLITVARAAAAQYANVSPVEHLYPMVRTQKQLDRVLAEIAEAPGIVLYTLLEEDLVKLLEDNAASSALPCLSILGPVLRLFQSYLGAETIHRVGAQHMLNAEYFKRIDALNYTMLHDDGQHVEGLGRGRCRAGRRVAHVENADLDLSRQSRRQNRQCAAGAGRAAGAASSRRSHGRWWSGSMPAPSASCRSAQNRLARPQGRITTTINISTSRGGRGNRVFAQAMRQAQLAESST